MSFRAELHIENQRIRLLVCEYNLFQRTDHNDKPVARTMAPPMLFVVESTDSTFFMDWALSSTEYKSGAIVFYRRDTESKMKELRFIDAKVTGFKELFNAHSDEPMEIEVRVSARILEQGSSTVDNQWPMTGGLTSQDKQVLSKKGNATDQQVSSQPGEESGVLSPVPKAPAIARIAKIRTRPPFTNNPKHDQAEFNRQLDGQEKGINKLTVEEFLVNRDQYLDNGRASEGSRAQKEYRKRALDKKIDELQNENEDLTYDEAEQQAQEWMSTQAALHDPDQIAGGKADHIIGMGDSRVNSSIGSQWKTRIKGIDHQIREIAKNMTEAEKKSTYLNISLDRI